MPDQIDINTVTDVNRLKALAYDQILAKEQVMVNLEAINRRISQLATTELQSKQTTPGPSDQPNDPSVTE